MKAVGTANIRYLLLELTSKRYAFNEHLFNVICLYI